MRTRSGNMDTLTTTDSDVPRATKRQGYSLADDLMPIVKGDVPVPNFERIDLAGTVANIAAVGHSLRPEWGYAKIDGHKVWTQYFLSPAAMGSARGDRPS